MPPLLQQWQSWKNGLDFRLRSRLNWELLPVVISKEACISLPEEDGIFQALRGRYEPFLSFTDLPPRHLPEILTYLHWLDWMTGRYPEAFQRLFATDSPLQWLDAGAKNWAYAPALHAFIRAHYGEDFRLDGVEVDPHRRYADFRTRGQTARAMIRNLPQAAYHEGDLRDWREPADAISHFLPFLFPETHLAWGLPLDFFDPASLLENLLARLRPGGLIMLVNQGEAEAERQESLLESATRRLPFRYESLGQMPSPFIQYRYPRYGWICLSTSEDRSE